MNRRNFMRTSFFTASGLALGSKGRKISRQGGSPLVIDAMAEIRVTYPMSLIREVLDSGTNVVRISLGSPLLPDTAYQIVVDTYAQYEHYIKSNSDYLMKAVTVGDIGRAKTEGRLALMYYFQNSTPIGYDLDKLDFFYNLGIRSMQLTYNIRNLVGDGCMDRTESGLSEFGINVIEKMNSLNMLVDLSHASMVTMADGIKFSKQTVIVGHSGCKAVYDHPRNTTDENMTALADKGGVIGIYQINPFLGPKQRNSLDDYLNHIDHAVNVAGIDHVGIGSDREHMHIPDTEEERRRLEQEMIGKSTKGIFRGENVNQIDWPFFIAELNGPRRMESVRNGLEKHGYKAVDIEKIMGGNFYRVFKEVIG
ncbi:dipeptidase [candidate division KSB1 bacterium]